MEIEHNLSESKTESSCAICHKLFPLFSLTSFSSSHLLSIAICPRCLTSIAEYDPFDVPEIDQINDKLFLGNEEAHRFLKPLLKSLHISHILLAGSELQAFHPLEFIYKKIEIEDQNNEEIKKYFEESFNYIEEAKGKIFVHCMGGVSRGPTIVIAYLMKKEGLGFNDAINFVKGKRKWVKPNWGFTGQLKEYEEELRKEGKTKKKMI